MERVGLDKDKRFIALEEIDDQVVVQAIEELCGILNMDEVHSKVTKNMAGQPPLDLNTTGKMKTH